MDPIRILTKIPKNACQVIPNSCQIQLHPIFSAKCSENKGRNRDAHERKSHALAQCATACLSELPIRATFHLQTRQVPLMACFVSAPESYNTATSFL